MAYKIHPTIIESGVQIHRCRLKAGNKMLTII